MHILDVNTPKTIRWQVEPVPPDVVWSSSGSIGILNPLIHDALRRRQVPDLQPSHLFFDGGRGVLITDAFGVVVREPPSAADKVVWLHEELPLLIACIRCASGQRLAGSGPFSLGEIVVEGLPEVRVPDKSTAEEVAAPATILESAVTPEDTELALEYFEQGGPPAPRSMLVDALDAYASGDYKKAIIYAAVAMETVAATVLDDEFKDRVEDTSDLSRWRVVEIAQPAGVVVKDPVFEMLRSGAKFGQLLHELSLYVRGRSLMLEDNALYADARRVYRTRNEIVHQAEPQDPEGARSFAIDRDSARSSVHCALNVCQWFGEGARFGLHDRAGSHYERMAVDTRAMLPTA